MYNMGLGIVKQEVSLTFVTLVFLAQKGGRGVNRPESKTYLMSSPLLHWKFTICGFSPFPILIDWLSWETDQLNSNPTSKTPESVLTKNTASRVEGWLFSIENFLHSKLINWCRVASSAWLLGLRLGILPTWDQPYSFVIIIKPATGKLPNWLLITYSLSFDHYSSSIVRV